MLDRRTRSAILELSRQGHGIKAIARLVGVSKNSVKRVLRSGSEAVPAMQRGDPLVAHLGLVRDLYLRCRGNKVRVHEELEASGVSVKYSTLTAFCRRHGIGEKEKTRAGRYHFEPGEEMQHDTSPHDVEVGGRVVRLQCASLILCFSRKQYVQVYPRWTRFEARVFFTDAIAWIGGSAKRCMLDNSTVIMARGTGTSAVPAAEMEVLASRFGFDFVAHRVGDANRSGRVERPFHHVENNFYAGRTFVDLADLNRQLITWCEKNFHRYRRSLRGSAAQLFEQEKAALVPLPPYIPKVYRLHRRRVCVEGYVCLHTNRYSVESRLIGQQVEVEETIDKVRVFEGHRVVAEHPKIEHGQHARSTLPDHRLRPRSHKKTSPSNEEIVLRNEGPEMVTLIERVRARHGGQAIRAMRQLHRIWLEYPSESVRVAIGEALRYGLTDLHRIERMVLRHIAGDFFRLPPNDSHDKEDDDEG